MDLPKAVALRALLAAARAAGVETLKITPEAVEVTFGPVSYASIGSRLVEDISRSAPTPEDPLDVIRREAAAGNKRPARDLLDALVDGVRLVETGNPDPTAPV